ncbi:MAG: hypothetical protein E7161_04305 [Firmicutes bacterium]|nr:hypothetical protein [Bacillota bacterium]
MKKERIEQFLGKKVVITLNDNDVKAGILHKEEDYPNDPNKLKDGGYLLRPCFTFPYYNFHFRKSHIKNIKDSDIK